MKRTADGAEKDPRICLNVGGRRLETRKSVLCAIEGSMLERMFCGDVPAVADEDGSYFFDRDGMLFEEYVLRYLRSVADGVSLDEILPPRGPPNFRSFVVTEFDFYGIPLFEEKKEDDFDAVQLCHRATARTGLTPISRAVIHDGLLIVQTKDGPSSLVKIFDLKTGEKKGVAFQGKLASSGTGAADGMLFVRASNGKLKRYDLDVFHMCAAFSVEERCEAFVLAKDRAVAITHEPVKGGEYLTYEHRLRAYDFAGSSLTSVFVQFDSSKKMMGIFFDGNDKVFLVWDRTISVYFLTSEKDDPVLFVERVKLASPLVAATVCDFCLCTATNNKIQMWDATDFREDGGKKFSFGLGKVKGIASIGKYVVASTGPSGDKIKIFSRDCASMIDQFALEYSPSSFDSGGRRLLLGKSNGDLDVWEC